MINNVVIEKCCSKCNETKDTNNFPKDRNVCKNCANAIRREKRKLISKEKVEVIIVTEKSCSKCNETKPIDKFVKTKNICKTCNNIARKEKYNTDEVFKNKLIESTKNHYKKKIENTKENQQLIVDKQCNVCNVLQPSNKFRIDRLKCIDCERNHGKEYRRNEIGKQKSKDWLENNGERMIELRARWFQNNKEHVNKKYINRMKNDPEFKFKKLLSRRILHCLKNKTMKTNKYLGCNSSEYNLWLCSYYNETINFENHGTVWHIDHVIPISTFNLEDNNEKLLAFNWRNTMPLLKEDNLSKNNKIDKEQIEQHLIHLTEYHKTHQLKIPHEFINLFAKHLVDGKFLKV
jgi:uncharacterized protein (DUF983 family)